MNWETYKILAIDGKYSFPYLSFSVFNLHTQMCGVGRKLFEELPKGRGRKPSEVSMIFYAVFLLTELHPVIISF